jgi:hypothetical protein
MCKSDTLPAGVDCAHSLRPVWRIVCFGKCRCRSPRVKSLKDTGSSARVRGSITPTSAARPGMIGVATVAPSVASGYAPAKAAFQSLIALTARTTRASSTCKPASVIKSLTAYCLRPVSIYLSIIRRSGFLILLGANNYSWVPPTHRWPDRKQRCQAMRPGAISGSGSSSSADYSTGIRGSMTQGLSGADLPDYRSEISSLIQAGLGHTVDEKTLSALAMMQERLQTRLGELGALLREHKISPKRYIDELDRTLIEASSTGEKLMGAEDFHKVFGELRADQLGDVSLFLERNNGPYKAL